MKFHRKTLTIDANQFDRLTDELNNGADKAGRDEVLACFTVPFDNGLEVDIRVVNCDDGLPWTEGILFQNCSEISCTEVFSKLDGKYHLHDGDDIYIVHVKKGLDKTIIV